MSVRLMAKAWEMDMPQGQKMVLLALCDHANDDGTCFPSQEKLAQKCSTTDDTVGRHIKWLKKHGVLSSERRQVGRKRLSDLYIISLENYRKEPKKQEPDNLEGSNLEGSNLPPQEPDNLEGCFKEEPPFEPSVLKKEKYKKEKNQKTEKHRLPDDWVLSEKNRQYAKEIGFDDSFISLLAEGFADYWHSEDAKNPFKSDWDSNWRNHVRDRKMRGYGKVKTHTSSNDDDIFKGCVNYG